MKLDENAVKTNFLANYDFKGNSKECLKKQRIFENEVRYVTYLTLKEDKTINENDNGEREKVIQLINSNQFDVNDYENFIKSLLKSKHPGFLTLYSVKEYMNDFTTYKVKGYDIGYAIKSDGDIVSVFNNSNVRNISNELIQSAIKHGGHKLDHFDGFLSGLYDKFGFKEYHRDKWNDEYKPQNWDGKAGQPDVVYRQLKVA